MDNIIQIDAIRIARNKQRKCTCKVRKYTIDKVNREVTCDCGVVHDPFEALLELATYYERINEQHKALNEQRQQWLREKPHSVLFKSLEQHYRRGQMFPYCPNCEQPFDFRDIKGWVNAEFFKKLLFKMADESTTGREKG